MEIDQKSNNKKNKTKKHARTETIEEGKDENNKIFKSFSAKEFRKELNHGNRLDALKQFLKSINEFKKHDYMFEYLESGGNCLELLQTLELDSTIPPVLVFELVAHLLLKISTIYAQYHSSAYEACRYILNNYIALVNKMISLSSSSQERKICLKLLSAMVTLSSTLAKDILLHVNFHSHNVELLTKNTGEGDSVRDHFVHFLSAYLVDGHYPTLSVLLEKKGFITSIISGLQYDTADTVCLVISAMKNHILENPSVSKTAKMKTFNTAIVRDIVNLYNWKGPDALRAQKKNKKSTNITVTVDEYAKTKVNECVHSFLLVLCTSHKFGVIFKDLSMTLGKKNQNALMYTVLESLERPWEHSYACELVTKICGACPDLAKTMWKNLRPFLEPRQTQKWLNAMKFAKILLKELQPTCIEFCVKEHGIYQLVQIIQFLVAPLPILKTIIPENHIFENSSIKRHVVSLLLEMLKSLECYLTASVQWCTADNHEKLKKTITMFITKNFPDAKIILDGWESKNDSDIPTISQQQFLEIVFDIFEVYRSLAPQLLDNLIKNVDLAELLTSLREVCNEEETNLVGLQIKIISIFVDLDPSKFSPKTELFTFILPLLFKSYYETNDLKTQKVLYKIFKNTGIFTGCLHEINIWINGILNLKTFDDSIAEGLVNVLRTTSDHFWELFRELSELKSTTEESIMGNIPDIKILSNVTLEHKSVVITHRSLSPMILGFLKQFGETEITKRIKIYSNFVVLNLFHCQTQNDMLLKFFQNYEVFPTRIKDYILTWINNKEITIVEKSKGRFDIFHSFSESFLSENIDDFLSNSDLNIYEDLTLNLLYASTFYISNLLINGDLTLQIVENCEKFVKHLIERKLFGDIHIKTILGHQILYENVSFLHLDKVKPQSLTTRFLLTVIRDSLKSGFNIEGYLQVYREKLFFNVLKILKKPQKYNDLRDFIEILRLFNLSYDQSCTVLSTLSKFVEINNEYLQIIFNVLIYSLEQTSCLCETDSNLNPLEENVVQNLSKYFVILNKKQEVNVSSLSLAFYKYLKVFPHNVKNLDEELFSSILNLNEYNKENVDLAVFLLERNIQLVESIKDNLDVICDKKGVLLPLLQILIITGVDEDILKLIFEKFKASLNKALQKPQKTGQHFHHNYKGLTTLVDKFMPLENCISFLEKVQKFEVAEVFHAKLLQVICNKVIDNNINSKQVNNIIMTFIHLQMVLFKRKTNSDEEVLKLNIIATIFNDILTKLQTKIADKELKTTAQNETLKLYFRYCLKFGISGQAILLKVLSSLINILASFIDQGDSKLILDMLLSHSEFLDKVLGEHNDVKLEILSLFLVLCKNWSEFLERSHIPVLLAAYRAMVNKCDRTILMLLRMCEARADQTNFYDFVPFLWGRAAASHYSVRLNVENSLLRQPKMSDVLEILQEDLIHSTIVNYPLRDSIHLSDLDLLETTDVKSYDMKFMLPVFSQILAPERQVQTYKFTRSGALSITVVCLSSQDIQVRQAAAHVLKRFYSHVEARQIGKDNLLWIRYVDAVRKGTILLPDYKLNNFSAIYLARMALILTQPNHVMYLPVSQHLLSKSTLDFSTVPELYTFLHSSEVNYKEHRNFMLELLKDGLRTEKDFLDFTKSMAFKLISALYLSCLSDLDTKLLILDVVKSVCKIPLGVKMICENNGFLSLLCCMVNDIFKCPENRNQDVRHFMIKHVEIFLDVAKTLQASVYNFNFLLSFIIKSIIKHDFFHVLSEENQRSIFEILNLVFDKNPDLFTEDIVAVLLDKPNDKFCKYIFEYGCNFINKNSLDVNDKYYYLRLLFVNKLKK